MINPILRRFSRISVLHLLLKMILTKTVSGTNYMFSENKEFRDSQPLAPSKMAMEILSISRCAQICMRNNDTCLAYGYNHESRVCALFEEYLSTPSQVFENGWNYFLKAKGMNFSHLFLHWHGDRNVWMMHWSRSIWTI